MIRRKKEREKDKEGEEGVYAPKKEDKSKGGDFIISNPKDRDKEKEKDKDKNLKQSINNNNDNKEQISSNENNSIKDDNLSSSLPDKDLQNVSNVYLNSNIDKYLNNNENNDIDKNKSFKGNKQLFRTNTLHLTKTSSISTNTTSGKSGIVDMKLNVDISKKIPNKQAIYRKNTLTILKDYDKNLIDDKKKNNKNTDIKNLADLHLAKKTAILENIIEEESKETKRPRISKDIGGKRKKTKKKSRKKRTTMRKDIKINTYNNNRKNSSSATSDYEAYSLNNDINSDNKSNNYPITSKYYKNEVNDNNYTNNINSEDKENINKEKEEEESSNEEDLLDRKYNSFCCNRPQISIGNDEEEDDEDNIRNNTISYFDSIKRKIDKIMSLKKDKNEIYDENKENDNKEENENEEEEESEKKERIKRQKKNINIKGVKGLFMDENNGEINDIGDIDDIEIEKIEEIPKKLGWEQKFELFKQYVKELKNMNEEQFNYDAMKYLKENVKEDFSGKAKLSQVERINRYKAFLIQAKAKRINYNNYYTSHVIFTPGCIFNTGELCK